jgi:hypothetical protein
MPAAERQVIHGLAAHVPFAGDYRTFLSGTGNGVPANFFQIFSNLRFPCVRVLLTRTDSRLRITGAVFHYSTSPHPRLPGLWVAMYFVAAFRPSAAGLFPLSADSRSRYLQVRLPSSRSKASRCAARMTSPRAGSACGTGRPARSVSSRFIGRFRVSP